MVRTEGSSLGFGRVVAAGAPLAGGTASNLIHAEHTAHTQYLR